jgi:hypothetical protein
MNVERLDATREIGWLLFPQLFRRIQRFSEEMYDGRVPPLLMRNIMIHYVTPFISPGAEKMRFYCGIDGNIIRAHMLLEICDDNGTPLVTISQYAVDDGFPFTTEQVQWIVNDALDWATKLGCQTVRVIARSEQHARAFSVFWGLKRIDRVLMSGEITEIIAKIKRRLGGHDGQGLQDER